MALCWPVKNSGLWLIVVCADFVPFASAVFEIDMDIASALVGLVPVGATIGCYIAIEQTPRALRPKSPKAIWDEGRGRRARVCFMVAASCDPAWTSQTEIGNKNDTLEEAVFQCNGQIFNRPG